jgi:polysaccharide chain length determinant protein (PEP-CTERM system associated)
MKNTQWPVHIYLWLLTVWRQRYLIVTLFLLLPLAGAAVGLLQPDRYESKMTILIQEAAKHNPFLEDFAVETRIKDRIAALDALLHSRHVLEGVANDLGHLHTETSDAEREDILSRLSSALHMRLIGNELVNLSLRQSSKDGIVRTLRAVAERFIEKVMAPERSSIAGSIQFLEEQLSLSAQELAVAEQELSVFLSANADHLPELHASNVQRLANLKLALSEKRTELRGAEAHLQSLLKRFSQSNPVVSQIERNTVRITTELAALSARYTDKHTEIIAAKRQLARLTTERNSIISKAPDLSAGEIETLWKAALQATEPDSGLQLLLVSQIESLQETKARIADLERQVSTLETEVTSLDGAIAGFGGIEKTLRGLQRKAGVKREIYEKLMERAEMARVTGALGQFEAPERVKIIDPPSRPTRPMGPPLFAYVAGGFMAAFVMAISLVALSEVTNTTLRRRDQVQALLDLPIITRIPHLPNLGFDENGLLPDGAPRRRRFMRLGTTT